MDLATVDIFLRLRDFRPLFDRGVDGGLEAERLKDGADGKPLKFKQSTVSNLVEFLSNFSFRNVTDDRQLQGLVGRARDLLQGVAADDLRTNSGLRARVQQGMATLATDLDGMLVKTGGRKLRLSEDEAS